MASGFTLLVRQSTRIVVLSDSYQELVDTHRRVDRNFAACAVGKSTVNSYGLTLDPTRGGRRMGAGAESPKSPLTSLSLIAPGA